MVENIDEKRIYNELWERNIIVRKLDYEKDWISIGIENEEDEMERMEKELWEMWSWNFD